MEANNLPDSFPWRDREGQWEVLLTNKNLNLPNETSSERWHPCSGGRDDADVIRKCPRLYAKSTSVDCDTPQSSLEGLAKELNHVASVLERNDAPANSVRAFRGRAAWIESGCPEDEF